MKTLLSLGHGYSARALGRRLLAQGWRVIGTTRTAEGARALAAEGVEARIWPGEDLPFAEATHLLSSIAPGPAGDPVLAAHRDAIAAARFDWVGYLSTVGVYGDHGGDWVDEETPLTPATARGRARVAAEAEWQAIPGLAPHIFRLAGIYGPGRGPFQKVIDGTARRIVKPGQVFSRIHVADIAAVLEASIAQPNPGRVYNVCDDEPAPPEDVLGYAAELLGLPVPPEVAYDEAAMSPMARSFYAESKRVSNARIKAELGVALLYPDYRAGLSALAQEEG